jgi:hypothetical protein
MQRGGGATRNEGTGSAADTVHSMIMCGYTHTARAYSLTLTHTHSHSLTLTLTHTHAHLRILTLTPWICIRSFLCVSSPNHQPSKPPFISPSFFLSPPPRFAQVPQPNACVPKLCLMYAVMKKLCIREVHCQKAMGSCAGLLVSPKYWQSRI